MHTIRKKIYIIAAFLLLWMSVGFLDFTRVSSFEKPLFCIGTSLHDDGSGHYIGLGYSFDVEGNFLPEDEFPGVTRYDYRICGIPIKTDIRD